MTHPFSRSLLLAMFLFTGTHGTIRGDEPVVVPEAERPVIQIAILLDNSGSMGGLIDQARSELWKIVNEFVAARRDGVRPRLEVAVYHYGNPPAVQLVQLTDDLDRVSEALFGIPVSGGSEYCGQVIDTATRELQWSESDRNLKLIFIAGNEPFTQGPLPYQDACQAAIARGIIVNTIHCGEGIPDDWRDGARLADGQAMNIDHTRAVVHIAAPQDEPLARLGVALNATYLAYGARGQEGAQRQAAQDKNAEGLSVASASSRAVAKANGFYRNAGWDLCDALRDGKVDLAKLKADELPEAMRAMTVAEREAYVAEKQEARAAIQQQIQELDAARKKFIVEKKKERAEDVNVRTLDQALIGAIRSQAGEKDYTFSP